MKRRQDTTPQEVSFPGYADVGEIASGTFASVYRATDLGSGRPVALKVMKVGAFSEKMAAAFQRELAALAWLSSHPNITTLYQSFVTPDGRPVLVLELCRESLAQRRRSHGALSAEEVVAAAIKVAGALGTAHGAGLLHRDVKPQNILLSRYGEPLLADFGVAALQGLAQSTEGLFGFTSLHASPEMLEGRPLTPASDVYALASTMYQLLTGAAPFAGAGGEAPASQVLRVLNDPVPRAPEGSMPRALADLLETALAKEQSQRPQSAESFARQLQAIETASGWARTPYVVIGPQEAPAPPHLVAEPPTGHLGSKPMATPPPRAASPAARQVVVVEPRQAERAVVRPLAVPRRVVEPVPYPPGRSAWPGYFFSQRSATNES